MSRKIYPVVWVGQQSFALAEGFRPTIGTQFIRALDLTGHVPLGTDEVGVDMDTIERCTIGCYMLRGYIKEPRAKSLGVKLRPCVLCLMIEAVEEA